MQPNILINIWRLAIGTHWYHAHYHGSSAYQIMSGLVGALLVESKPSQNIPLSITQADSYLLVITHIKFDQEVSPRNGKLNQGCGNDTPCDPVVQAPLCTAADVEPAPYESFRIYSYLELGAEVGNTMEIDYKLADASIKDMKLVNGQFIPTLSITQDSAAILRVISASGGGQLDIVVNSSGVCDMYVIAYDGVYLDAKLHKEVVRLVEGSRADIEILCTHPGIFNVYDLSARMELFSLQVAPGSEHKPLVTDSELAAIVKPSYLQDLMGSDVQVDSYYSMHTWRNGLNHSICGHWLGSGYNCSSIQPMGTEEPNASSTVCPFNQFEGERGLNPENYTRVYKLVTPLNAVNEWTIFGMGNDQHPVSIMIYT